MSSEERKEQIKRSAMKIIIEKGLRNVVMEDIMHDTGLSRGGLYHHYGSVNEILYEIMDDGNKRRARAIDITLKEKTDLNFTETLAKIIVDKMLTEDEFISVYAMFLQEIPYDKNLEELYKRLKNEVFENLIDLFGDNDIEILKNHYELIADLINTFILSCEVLKTRENFLLEKEMLIKMIAEALRS